MAVATLSRQLEKAKQAQIDSIDKTANRYLRDLESYFHLRISALKACSIRMFRGHFREDLEK